MLDHVRPTHLVIEEVTSTYSRSIIEMKMSLLDTLPVISLGVRQPKQTFFQKVTGYSSIDHSSLGAIYPIPDRIRRHTLSRSRMQMQCSAGYGYPKRQQSHPRPSDTSEIVHSRARSLDGFSSDDSDYVHGHGDLQLQASPLSLGNSVKTIP